MTDPYFSTVANVKNMVGAQPSRLPALFDPTTVLGGFVGRFAVSWLFGLGSDSGYEQFKTTLHRRQGRDYPAINDLQTTSDAILLAAQAGQVVIQQAIGGSPARVAVKITGQLFGVAASFFEIMSRAVTLLECHSTSMDNFSLWPLDWSRSDEPMAMGLRYGGEEPAATWWPAWKGVSSLGELPYYQRWFTEALYNRGDYTGTLFVNVYLVMRAVEKHIAGRDVIKVGLQWLREHASGFGQLTIEMLKKVVDWVKKKIQEKAQVTFTQQLITR